VAGAHTRRGLGRLHEARAALAVSDQLKSPPTTLGADAVDNLSIGNYGGDVTGRGSLLPPDSLRP
jgi:hypothetical protein